MPLFRRTLALPLLAVLVGCPGLGNQEPPIADTLPAEPTWTEHVKPILDTYCSECHSDPPQQAAPGTFRLDVCETLGKPGASSQSAKIVIRMIDEIPSPMPPLTAANQPTPDDEEIVRRWVDQGANCDGAANNGTNNGNTNNGTNNGTVAMDMGMGGTDMAPDMVTDEPWTFTEVGEFLRTTCGLDDICHGGAMPSGNFIVTENTSDADLAATLMGMTPGGVLLISPSEPDASRIVQVLESAFMPFGGPPRPDEAAKIREWVATGADDGL